MKRLGLILGCSALAMVLSGCGPLHKMVRSSAKEQKAGATASLPVYSGPKAQIAVADFEVRAGKATAQIGFGLREMLAAALVESGRFLAVEQSSLGAIIQEQESANAQTGQGDSGRHKDKPKAAEVVITATIVEFEPQASGGSAGIGGGGGVSSGMLGGLLGTDFSNKAHMALDIRVIDISTSEVLAANRIYGQASDTTGVFFGGSLGNRVLGSGLSAYVNTPMEKAMRVCVIEAARYIAQVIPVNYYKY
jgi:curli biogenesis system outer membrane secretion channel CsgG